MLEVGAAARGRDSSLGARQRVFERSGHHHDAEVRCGADPGSHQGDVGRRVRRARAGDEGRRAHRPVPRGGVQEARAPAGKHRRHVRAEGAARRHHRDQHAAADHRRRRGHEDLQVEGRGRRLDQARRRRRGDQRLRDDLCRLRRDRARVQLGRLQGRRRQGQDHRRARERPAGARRRRSREARRQGLQRQGDDVLRPLDLQVRGGREARCRRHPDRARGRPRRLPVPGRAGQPTREIRPRHARQEHGAFGDRRMGHARDRQGDPEDGRPGLRRAEEAVPDPRFQASAAQPQGVDRCEEHAAHHRLAQRAREARGQRSHASQRARRLYGALGSPRAWAIP